MAAGTREAVGVEVRQVVDLCKGEKGREVRRNAEKVKEEFGKAWDDDEDGGGGGGGGGDARWEIRKFLDKYSSC